MGYYNEEDYIEIVKCSRCGQDEYWGMLTYGTHSHGHTMCRRCIYEVWEQESGYWKRQEKDLIFPLYEDGKDYRKEAKDE